MVSPSSFARPQVSFLACLGRDPSYQPLGLGHRRMNRLSRQLVANTCQHRLYLHLAVCLYVCLSSAQDAWRAPALMAQPYRCLGRARSYRGGPFLFFFPFGAFFVSENAKISPNPIGAVLELFRTSNAHPIISYFSAKRIYLASFLEKSNLRLKSVVAAGILGQYYTDLTNCQFRC